VRKQPVPSVYLVEPVDPRRPCLRSGGPACPTTLALPRDVRKGFIPLQQKLAAHDALNEYITHTGSAIFAVPPGIGPGDYWGQSLLS